MSISGGFLPAVISNNYIANPNVLINPFAEIDQANEGVAITANGYVIDMWKAAVVSSGNSTNLAWSAARSTDAPPGFTNSIKFTATTGASAVSAGDYAIIYQPIEANNIINLNLGTSNAVILSTSFWQRCTIPNYNFSVAVQNFAGTRSIPFNFTTGPVTNVWQQFTISFVADTLGTWVTSGTAGGMLLVMCIGAGTTFQGTPNIWAGSNYYGTALNTNSIMTTTGATFEFTGTKLENSAISTLLQRNTFADTLVQCQRYCEKSYDVGTTLGTATHNSMAGGMCSGGSYQWGINIPFAVAKRVDPTISTWDGAGHTNCCSDYNTSQGWNDDYSGNGIISAGTKGFVVANTQPWSMLIHYFADARL
jgi:hypothetical protein